MTTFILILQLLCALALIVIITMQTGKSSGLSGSIGGGNENFFGKGKAKSRDAILGTATKWVAGAFVLLTFILALLGTK